tara:strand:- start:33 stop:206 length:174 start_codon:yes stop_codon:yes gene_type:complete
MAKQKVVVELKAYAKSRIFGFGLLGKEARHRISFASSLFFVFLFPESKSTCVFVAFP